MLETEEVNFDDKHFLIADFAPGNFASLIMEKKLPGCTICFLVSGSAEIYFDARHLAFYQNQYIVFPAEPLTLLIEVDRPLKLVVLSFEEAIVSELFEDNRKVFLEPLPIIPALVSILHSMAECKHTGYSRRIFYESKMLEVLLMISKDTRLREQNRFVSIKTYDLNKIYQAKKFIELNIQSPCSLIELAHKVGLNDFKLKRGFKEVIGTTVFGYLYDYRMEKARRLLENGASVNEVSYEVGYKNAHHFTAAFKKKYGILPRLLKKQNRGIED